MRLIASLCLAAGAALSVGFAAPAAAQTSAAVDHAELRALGVLVQPERMRADIQTMVDFGTHHTMSETQSEMRGIGAARRWAEREFVSISAACGGCLEIVTPSDTVTGRRVPTPTEVVDVVAIQRGTGDPNRVIIISGHLDSRVTDVMDFTSDAPGANDDASGVAAVLEAARILSAYEFDATLVYAVLSGEEQGLLGGKILADYATERGWFVQANLNNDIVGNSEAQSGIVDTTRVRVFSEAPRRSRPKPRPIAAATMAVRSTPPRAIWPASSTASPIAI